MRLIVNIAQAAGLVLLVVAAFQVTTAVGLAFAGASLCGLSWLHDPDRRKRS